MGWPINFILNAVSLVMKLVFDAVSQREMASTLLPASDMRGTLTHSKRQFLVFPINSACHSEILESDGEEEGGEALDPL